MPPINTARLTLLPLTIEVVQAALEERAALERMLSIGIPGGWPGPDFKEVLPLIAEMLRADPSYSEWVRMITHRSDRRAIGSIGFKELPDYSAGTVEIGYDIVPDYWGSGYATEAANALIDWAFSQPGVRRVVAECLSDNVASARVLEKVGMRPLPAEGDMLKWELAKD
jgi:RimJ/RimL family protein N-acetyltransferase